MYTKASHTTRRERGVALIIVLAMLVLISGLLVAFLNTVTTERNATTMNANSVAARTIADSTVNMVIAQIREATTRYTDSAAWYSQPGLIRTVSGSQGGRVNFERGAYYYSYQAGADDWVYKLYSSDQMRESATAYDPSSGTLKDEIKAIEEYGNAVQSAGEKPEGYVDMNEPIVSRRPDPEKEGDYIYEPRYPIFDPRAKLSVNETDVTNNFGLVEGFDATTFTITGDQRRTAKKQPIRLLPMPVRWLYVLRDGTIGPKSIATEQNPIVGRTAFWTDDETSKINVNTASEGTFWDTPSASTSQESGNVSTAKTITSASNSLSLGASQPCKGEYQRYPGHPATTCLSPVLGWLWNTPRGIAYNSDPNYRAFKEAIYAISPFMPSGQGTSQEGMGNTDADTQVDAQGNPKLNIGSKHLYNNIDEFIFNPTRFTGDVGTTTTATLNGKLTPEALEEVRGFITANSRSPELNIFNRPRVTIWPLNNDPIKRTNYDNLFAFASSIGGKAYHFTRAMARDTFTDYNLPQNVAMLNYLQWLTGGGGNGTASNARTKIPGFSGNWLQTKYAANGGGDGTGERDQILALMFDYIRSVNLVDTGTTRVGTYKFIPYTPFFGQGQAGYGSGGTGRSYDWSGQVTPTVTPNGGPLTGGLHGMGRFLTISEAALVFYRSGDAVVSPSAQKQQKMQCALMFEITSPMPGFPAIRDTYFTKVTCRRPFYVTPVYPTGLGTKDVLFSDADTQMDHAINVVNVSSHECFQGRGFMPTLGFANSMVYFAENRAPTNPDKYPNDPAHEVAAAMTIKRFGLQPNGYSTTYKRRGQVPAGQETVTWYPYVGPNTLTKPKGTDIWTQAGGYATQFVLEGGRFEVEIWAGEAPDHPDARLVQTVELDFGAGDPTSPGPCPASQRLPVPDGNPGDGTSFPNRFGSITQEGKPKIFDTSSGGLPRCTIRSIEYVGCNKLNGQFPLAQQGDIRLEMTMDRVPAMAFAPRDRVKWQDQNTYMVHGLNQGHGGRLSTALGTTADWGGGYSAYGSTGSNNSWGVLARGSRGSAHGDKHAILPAGIDGVQNVVGAQGDFDRGISKHLDSAAGNKVDEGNLYFSYTDNDQGGRVPYFRGRGIEETGQSFFTPNRQLPSAVMFGSLPSGAYRRLPWQTMLFRPDRSVAQHPGAVFPEDHLWLDLFNIPIVEPYAISEPFSTSGKVNLNYTIAPFGYVPSTRMLPRPRGNPTQAPSAYIYRDTALRGVLRSTKVMAIPTNAGQFGHAEQPVPIADIYRYDIQIDETMANIQKRVTDKRIGQFRSASEICTVDLYPDGKPVANWAQFWDNDNTQTGDNMRERPYAQIYPRVTTKSNAYTVHMRTQTVQIAPSAKGKDGRIDYAKLDDKDIQVTGEYRGSAIIERYVDPNDDDLTNYSYLNSVDPYYRFRVVATKQFNPR